MNDNIIMKKFFIDMVKETNLGLYTRMEEAELFFEVIDDGDTLEISTEKNIESVDKALVKEIKDYMELAMKFTEFFGKIIEQEKSNG